jgi:hypothetical protein
MFSQQQQQSDRTTKHNDRYTSDSQSRDVVRCINGYLPMCTCRARVRVAPPNGCHVLVVQFVEADRLGRATTNKEKNTCLQTGLGQGDELREMAVQWRRLLG